MANAVCEHAAEPFDDGHLLEREGALEKLPAVQTAAQNEMAFKQRAAVAENLQHFVFCHRASFTFHVSRFKSDRFLLASDFQILNSARVPKWIKTIIAILLLPVCFGAASALWMVIQKSGSADTTWVPMLAGAACWGVIFFLLPKPMWIYVFGHELTHAVWTWLFGGQVKKFKASSTGGHVVISKSNFVIALAPYFFPLYAVLVVAVFAVGQFFWSWQRLLPWFHLFLGAAYAFHVTLTWHVLKTRQSDITEQGYIFSAVVIFLGNVAVLLLGIPLLAAKVGVWTSLGWWFECTGEVFHRLGKLF
jgi:hypothetical protein